MTSLRLLRRHPRHLLAMFGLLGGLLACDGADSRGSRSDSPSAVPPESFPPTTATIPIEPGRVEGELTADDPLALGFSHDAYEYQGRPGELLTVEMTSPVLDTYLTLQRKTERGLVPIDADNDSGVGSNARLQRELPETGTYIIGASSAVPGKHGEYSLSLQAEDLPRYAISLSGSGRYAVIVSIADYPLGNCDLVGPDRDAELFTELLLQRFGFQPEDIVHLRNAEATRLRLQQTFGEFLGRARPQDLVVFYFTGHGIKIADDLLPADLDPAATEPHDARNEALLLADASFLLDDELGVLLDRLAPERVLCVLDCCFSGGALRGLDGFQVKRALAADLGYELRIPATFIGRGSAKSVSSAGSTERTLALTASLESQEAFIRPPSSGGDAAVSLFTDILVRSLQDSADLSFRALMDAVGAETSAYARQHVGTDQRPLLRGPVPDLPVWEFLR